jgi:DNA-directed RNA polymerase subunit N (RpoN/RPB10)
MLYYKCPTCQTVLANKQIIYEERLNTICNGNMSDDEKNLAKRKLLAELEIHRPCCRMRVLGYIKLIDLIH